MRDTAALLDFLGAQPDARPGRIGVNGYCMGGRLALTAAGALAVEAVRVVDLASGVVAYVRVLPGGVAVAGEGGGSWESSG